LLLQLGYILVKIFWAVMQHSVVAAIIWNIGIYCNTTQCWNHRRP